MIRALRALLPGGAVLLLAIGFMSLASDEYVENFAETYGLVAYGAGLALAWVFYRSRAFIALTILAWMDIAIVGSPNPVELLMGLGTVVILLMGMLGVVRDRGVASQIGVIQAVIVSVVAAIGGLYFAGYERVQNFATNLKVLPLENVVWPGYPLLTLVVTGLALLGVAYGFHRYRGPVERSFVWAVLLLLVAMHPEMGRAGSALFVMASGLTLTLGIVETSYVLAYRDELTGLPGRRALMQYLDGAKGTYAIAMVDVDHFKKFNDKHGHDVGDQVLKLVASRLQRGPGGGRAYRYGGEEFTLLFPGRTREQAMDHLEAIRENIQDARFHIRSWKRPRDRPDGTTEIRKSKELQVTISLGVASTDGKDPYEVVLKRADQALYRAKKKGRNQVSQ
ncbi:MAG: GGDEF domain-containing protein [Gemmatimonadota bacterium]